MGVVVIACVRSAQIVHHESFIYVITEDKVAGIIFRAGNTGLQNDLLVVIIESRGYSHYRIHFFNPSTEGVIFKRRHRYCIIRLADCNKPIFVIIMVRIPPMIRRQVPRIVITDRRAADGCVFIDGVIGAIITGSAAGAGIDHAVAVARALFCGAQAGILAYGRKIGWKEKVFEYDSQFGVEVSSIYGFSKAKFNSEDFGVITCDTRVELDQAA